MLWVTEVTLLLSKVHIIFWCSVLWQVSVDNLIFNGLLTHIVINFYRVQCTPFLMLNSSFISCHRMMKSVIGGCVLHHKYSSSAAQLSLGFFSRKFLKWQFYDSMNQNKVHKFPSSFTYVIMNESCWSRKMKAFIYFYKVYLQKWRDGYVGLWCRGYPIGPKDAISSQICVWGEGGKWKKWYFNSYRIAPQLAIGNRASRWF